MPRTRDLTKSRYMAGLRCPKLLWTFWNHPDSVPPPDAAREPIIQSGRQVHDLGKRLMNENSVEVPRFDTADEAVTATAKLLDKRVTIFEAAFTVAGRHCRADALVPNGTGWDLVEIKAGGKVRENHIRDLAFQYDTISRSGLEIERVHVVHLRAGYMRQGDIELEKLFKFTDVTERVMNLVTYTDRTIRVLQKMVEGPDPDTPIGSRCNVPHPCPLKPVCWADLPPDNVTMLYHGSRKAWELMDEGLFTMASVPDERLTVHQRLQKQAVTSGVARFDQVRVSEWLGQLTWPVHFLDFETMAPAVPAFDGIRPYQQIPFQYSLHIQREPGAKPEHREFLATEPGDPRTDLAAALAQDIEPEGTVLAWNMDFEKLVMQELAEHDTSQGLQIALVIERLADLMWPFTNFYVHHPDQKGSCSLKAVLPAVTDLDYSDLDIAEGASATHGYERAMFGGISPAARGRIFSDLLVYCRRDTEALVAILDWLHAESARLG